MIDKSKVIRIFGKYALCFSRKRKNEKNNLKNNNIYWKTKKNDTYKHIDFIP